jgi:hypothetical protein
LAAPDEVADQLEAVRLVWLRTGDERTLRRALLDLLRLLEQAELKLSAYECTKNTN